MKKIILLIVIAMITLISNQVMRGQDCPSGWQQRIVRGYPQCPNAEITIEVCCSITGGQLQFRYIGVSGCLKSIYIVIPSKEGV